MKRYLTNIALILTISVTIFTLSGCEFNKKEKNEKNENNAEEIKIVENKTEKNETSKSESKVDKEDSNLKGKELPFPINITAGFSGGRGIVYNKDTKMRVVIDNQGNIITDQYKEVGRYSEGLARYLPAGSRFINLGFIDKDGKVVIQAKYSYVRDFKEGIVFCANGSTGYIIDKTGAVLATLKNIYGTAGEYSEGLLQIANKDNKKGYVDKNGKVVIDFQYDTAEEFSEGLAQVSKDGKYGFIDKQGKTVIDFIYSTGFNQFVGFHNGYAAVKKDKKVGMIDKKGNTVINFEYDELSGYTEEGGLILAKKNGKYGYIDIKGNVVIDFQYDKAYHFSEGLARVQKNKKEGFIDKKGNVVVDFKFDPYSGADLDYMFSEGLAPVCKDDKYGYIDKTGKVVIGNLN